MTKFNTEFLDTLLNEETRVLPATGVPATGVPATKKHMGIFRRHLISNFITLILSMAIGISMFVYVEYNTAEMTKISRHTAKQDSVITKLANKLDITEMENDRLKKINHELTHELTAWKTKSEQKDSIIYAQLHEIQKLLTKRKAEQAQPSKIEILEPLVPADSVLLQRYRSRRLTQ